MPVGFHEYYRDRYPQYIAQEQRDTLGELVYDEKKNKAKTDGDALKAIAAKTKNSPKLKRDEIKGFVDFINKFPDAALHAKPEFLHRIPGDLLLNAKHAAKLELPKITSELASVTLEHENLVKHLSAIFGIDKFTGTMTHESLARFFAKNGDEEKSALHAADEYTGYEDFEKTFDELRHAVAKIPAKEISLESVRKSIHSAVDAVTKLTYKDRVVPAAYDIDQELAALQNQTFELQREAHAQKNKKSRKYLEIQKDVKRLSDLITVKSVVRQFAAQLHTIDESADGVAKKNEQLQQCEKAIEQNKALRHAGRSLILRILCTIIPTGVRKHLMQWINVINMVAMFVSMPLMFEGLGDMFRSQPQQQDPDQDQGPPPATSSPASQGVATAPGSGTYSLSPQAAAAQPVAAAAA